MAEVNLNELRRYAILNRTLITYLDRRGRIARVNRKGIIEIPGIAGAPPYDVAEVLGIAEEFVLEPEDSKAQLRRLNRQQFFELLASSAPAAAPKEKEE